MKNNNQKIYKYFPNFSFCYYNSLNQQRLSYSKNEHLCAETFYYYLIKLSNDREIKKIYDELVKSVVNEQYAGPFFKFKEGYLYDSQFDIELIYLKFQDHTMNFLDIIYSACAQHPALDYNKFLNVIKKELEFFLKEYDIDNDKQSCYEFCEVIILKQLLIEIQTELAYTNTLLNIRSH